MSHMSRGQRLEAKVSLQEHARGVALLVEPALLRRRGLGQVDVAVLVAGRIIISEVKSAPPIYFSLKQRLRLRASANFLGLLLGRSAQLKLVSAHLSIAF